MKFIYFILGPPGSGKGTQCKLLEKKINCIHISVGELLRNERLKNTKNSKLINSFISKGLIVPSNISLELIENKIKDCSNEIILLDGFPRNMENLNLWLKTFNYKNIKCIFFDCGYEIILQRLLQRTDKRDDDNINIIKKRYEIFIEQTMPVIKYFDKNNMIYKVNTEFNVNDIFSNLYSYFNNN